MTGQETPFKEAIDWFKFAYNTDWVVDCVSPAPTALAHSVISKGGGIFPVILLFIRRLYSEVYDPAVSLGQAPARRDFPLREDGKYLVAVILVLIALVN